MSKLTDKENHDISKRIKKDRQSIQDFLSVAGNNRGKSLSTTTKRTYENALKNFSEWLIYKREVSLERFSREDVQQYILFLQEKRSPFTVKKIYAAICKYVEDYYKNKDVITNISITEPPNLLNEAPKSLGDSERRKLKQEVELRGSKRDIAIVYFLLNTGVRVHELHNLNRSDVRLSERKGEATIRGKGNKIRVVEISKETRKRLQEYLNERHDDLECLFVSSRKKRLAIRSIQQMLEKYGHHAHALRHTFITRHVRELKTDIGMLQQLTGHTSAEMIARYSRATSDERQAQQDLLDID